MEPSPNESIPALAPLFSFSNWKKMTDDPKMRRIELALIFGIGIIFGIALKSVAVDTFTIGYQDYTVSKQENSIDFNIVEREVLSKKSDASDAENTNAGEVCSQE